MRHNVFWDESIYKLLCCRGKYYSTEQLECALDSRKCCINWYTPCSRPLLLRFYEVTRSETERSERVRQIGFSIKFIDARARKWNRKFDFQVKWSAELGNPVETQHKSVKLSRRANEPNNLILRINLNLFFPHNLLHIRDAPPSLYVKSQQKELSLWCARFQCPIPLIDPCVKIIPYPLFCRGAYMRVIFSNLSSDVTIFSEWNVVQCRALCPFVREMDVILSSHLSVLE